MSDDLISKQAAIDTFEKELSAKYNGRELAIGFVGIESILKNEPLKVLESAPTADVVEVVRCKDCEFWRTESDPIGIECEPGETAHYCDMDGMITRSGDFCSYGERRTEDITGLLQTLMRNDYVCTIRCDEPSFEIYVIEFDYDDEKLCDTRPYWLTPEQFEKLQHLESEDKDDV